MITIKGYFEGDRFIPEKQVVKQPVNIICWLNSKVIVLSLKSKSGYYSARAILTILAEPAFDVRVRKLQARRSL